MSSGASRQLFSARPDGERWAIFSSWFCVCASAGGRAATEWQVAVKLAPVLSNLTFSTFVLSKCFPLCILLTVALRGKTHTGLEVANWARHLATHVLGSAHHTFSPPRPTVMRSLAVSHPRTWTAGSLCSMWLRIEWSWRVSSHMGNAPTLSC